MIPSEGRMPTVVPTNQAFDVGSQRKPYFRFSLDYQICFCVEGVRDSSNGYAYLLNLYDDGFVEIHFQPIADLNDPELWIKVIRGSNLRQGLQKAQQAGMSEESAERLILTLENGLNSYLSVFETGRRFIEELKRE